MKAWERMHSCWVKRNKGPGKSPWNLGLKGRPSDRKGKKKKKSKSVATRKPREECFRRRSGQAYQMMVGSQVAVVDLMYHYILLPGLSLSFLQLLGDWAAKKSQLTPPWELTSPVGELQASQVFEWYRICLPSRRRSFDPWVWKIPWRRIWQPAAVFFPGKSHGTNVFSLHA